MTGILITFRGFDTLGEVAVLFMVAAGIGILLGQKPQEEPAQAESDEGTGELIESGAEVVLPLILLFGAYVIMNGHLSAGGGFQGERLSPRASCFCCSPFPRPNCITVS